MTRRQLFYCSIEKVEEYFKGLNDKEKLSLAVQYIEKYCDTEDFYTWVGNGNGVYQKLNEEFFAEDLERRCK